MKYVYEFIGTFFLVLTVGMTVLNPIGVIVAPLAIGSILAVMVFTGGHVSGGHFNPAVSLSVFLRNKLSIRDLWIYWVVQLAAAVAAGFLTIYFKGRPQEVVLSMETIKPFIAEFLFTFALCFVVLNVATSKETKGNSFYGFAIGFTVLVGAYAVGTVSGAAFNPAVALGISIMHITAWSALWIFIVANLLGGAFAALIYKAGMNNEQNQS
ncbi:MAG: aquaporin [Chlamydiales bacterium]